jgi:hypothetical protein
LSSSASDSKSDNTEVAGGYEERDRAQRAKHKAKKQKKPIKELKKKLLIQARSGFKAEKPKAYNWDNDFPAFERFVFNYDNWRIHTKQNECESVRHISRVLKGKALTWYMSNVATDQALYTMSRIYQELFEYCFPPDFREKMCKEYERFRQGNLSVQDYFAKLNQLRRRLKEVSN